MKIIAENNNKNISTINENVDDVVFDNEDNTDENDIITNTENTNDTANIDNADNNNTDIEEPPIGSDTELQESVVLDEQ